jgi:diadenosine tetraphosphate (Ap4A) HIT family hydrolase
MSCIFCKIIARQLPSYIIAEDESTIVFVSLEGHPIVAPKEHIPDIFGLNDKLASMIMNTAREVAWSDGRPLDRGDASRKRTMEKVRAFLQRQV